MEIERVEPANIFKVVYGGDRYFRFASDAWFVFNTSDNSFERYPYSEKLESDFQSFLDRGWNEF